MKTLLISPVPPPAGGDSTWAEKYLLFSQEQGLDVQLVNTSVIGSRAVTVNDSVDLLDEVKRCFRIWNGVRKSCRVYRPEIAHMNTNCSPRGVIRDYISSRILRFYHIPYLVHCRCNVEDQIGNGKIGMFFFKRLCRSAHRILVQNNMSLSFVEKLFPDTVVLMPNFIEKSKTVQQRKINQEIKKVIYVGHVKRTKGVDEILEVADRFPDIEFQIVGPITEDYSEESLTKRQNIQITGAVSGEKVIELIDEADVLLFPTYTEGFSNSLLEAMARGLPVITTTVGANCDMLEGKGGVCVQPRDVKGLVDSIHNIEDYRIRERMSRWNIEKVLHNYTIECVMDRLQKEYEEIVSEKNC